MTKRMTEDEIRELLTTFWDRESGSADAGPYTDQVSTYATVTDGGVTLYLKPFEEIRHDGNLCVGAAYFFRRSDGMKVSGFDDPKPYDRVRVAFFCDLPRLFGDVLARHADQLRPEPEASFPSP